MLERAAQGNNEQSDQQLPDTAPPAYTAEPPEDNMSDFEAEDDPSPISLTFKAGTQIEGTGNMIATPPLADATRLSTLLLAAVQRLNTVKTEATETGSQPPVLHVNLTINCGITVNGDRNVIGYKTQGVLPTSPKRKAPDEVCFKCLRYAWFPC